MKESVNAMQGNASSANDKFMLSIKHMKDVCSKYF